jgi:hypothetical protein
MLAAVTVGGDTATTAMILSWRKQINPQMSRDRQKVENH